MTDLGRFAAYEPDPDRAEELAPLTCPSCGQRGTLRDTVPGWLVCACGWHGEQETIEAKTERKEILDCLREDARKGHRGGGSSNRTKRTPKPGDRLLTSRPEQEPLGMPSRPQATTTVVDRKSKSVLLRLTPGDKAMLDGIALERGVSVTDVLMHGLQLTFALSTRQWRWWAREADSRRLTPEQLLYRACNEWAQRHVPDVPLL